ncbi:uncharacterized protein LOC117582089 [Drosophila guanche]|uniref:Blast:Nuclear factor NF-kappa-B p110 subunit n=1 Tax=Drosophila guanche TaxID=7266 RepID=A0A3B0JWQ5_DROGU|nr:uncharacterized protein LOC117582089 [Drosophila guanche]SPP79930.1 blast:Nuclear factor NF-kappa-B p110 subunit [Drosophila guanche]
MKKVLLPKTQRIQRVPSDTDLVLKQTAPVRVVARAVPLNSNAYIQRKSFQSIYEDIFRLLLRIPDKGMQQRVMDAINGHGSDKTSTTFTSQLKRQCYCGASKANASTQTDEEPRPSISYRHHTTPNSPQNMLLENDSPDSGAPSGTSPSPARSAPLIVGKKRGRKRNNCVPKVVKVSAAEQAQQEREDKQLTPVIIKKKKLDLPEPAIKEIQRPISERRSSNISVTSISVCQGLEEMDSYIENGPDKEQLKALALRIMTNEFKTARFLSPEGLLPIHDAILRGDINAVRRQIFTCTHNHWNINEMLSSEGEDCLELALMNDADPELVTDLLKAGCLPNHIYENSNTALHIAVINNIDLESIRQLMLHIDLELLLKTNDDGYTALHLTVRHNQYNVAETILDCIDKRQLDDEPVYERATEVPDPKLTPEKAFAKYYERACDRLELTKHRLKDRRLKMDILNAVESRAGNTPLFFAVEQEQEHFCYFLLAHLCDPDQENLSGHSPKSFHYEYARILRINLKISRIMDKVIGILNG